MKSKRRIGQKEAFYKVLDALAVTSRAGIPSSSIITYDSGNRDLLTMDKQGQVTIKKMRPIKPPKAQRAAR